MERTDAYSVFAHLSAEKAARYRAVLSAFMAAKERFRLHLRPTDVLELLDEGSEEEVQALLNQLVAWGNLRADVDTAEVTTVEEFYRPRHLYQITAEGEAAERALAHFRDNLETPGELQTTALGDIRSLLGELAGLAADDHPDPAKVHLTLRNLFGRFEELTDRAQAFISELQRTVDLHGVDLEAFVAYKDRLIEYLERFIGELVVAQWEIAAEIGSIQEAGVGRLLDRAADRDLEDALEGDDPERRESTREAWAIRWQGLTEWFVAGAGRRAQGDILRARARSAIPALLRAVQHINERRVSRTDRPADLRCLARWFAAADSDGAAHRLWRVAFGLAPARHLAVDEETLDRRDRSPVPTSTSWLDDEPLRISPRLRKTGRYVRRGKPDAVVDRSREKGMLARMAEEEAAQLAEARRRLATDGPTRLSEMESLDRETFGLFLDLLGEALARKVRPNERARAVAADGTLEIALVPTGDGRTATIRTAWGDLRGLDHVVEIVDLVAGPRPQPAETPA